MRNKYLSDYALEERTNAENGKIQRIPVYRGKYYVFCRQGRDLKRTRFLFAGLTALCALAFLSALTVNAPCGHRWYVMFPLALMIFPLFFQAESCVLLTAKEKLERSERDKIEHRTVITSAFLALFSFFSLAGHVVSMILYQESLRDIVYLVSAVVILASSLVMIAARKGLKTEEVP